MIRNVQVEFNGDLSVPTGAVSGSSFVLTRLARLQLNIGLTVVSRNFAARKDNHCSRLYIGNTGIRISC